MSKLEEIFTATLSLFMFIPYTPYGRLWEIAAGILAWAALILTIWAILK